MYRSLKTISVYCPVFPGIPAKRVVIFFCFFSVIPAKQIRYSSRWLDLVPNIVQR